MINSIYKSLIGRDKVKKNIFYVPVENALIGLGGLGSYTLGEYNPYVRQVKELMKNPDIKYRDSLIKNTRDRVVDLIENNDYEKLLGENLQPELYKYFPDEIKDNLKSEENLIYIPYRGWITSITKNAKKTKYIHRFSLGSDKFYPRKGDFHTLKSLYKSIKGNGYNPEEYLSINSSFIQGDLLKEKWNFKFHIASGRHRAAVLAALGYKEIPVIFYDNRKSMNKLKTARYHHILDVDNVENWLVVKNKIYPPEFALKLFDLYYNPDEKYKANLLGIG